MSKWEHAKLAAQQVEASRVIESEHGVFFTHNEAMEHIRAHNLVGVTVVRLENEQGHTIHVIKNLQVPSSLPFDPPSLPVDPDSAPRHVTMGEFMRESVHPSGFIQEEDQDTMKSFAEKMRDIALTSPTPNVIPTRDGHMGLDQNGNAVNLEALRVRQGYLSLLNKLSIEDAKHIHTDNLLKAAMAHCNIEAIISETLFKAGRQSTMNSVHRVLDFMTATTQSVKPMFEEYVDTAVLEAERNKKDYQKDMDNMLLLLNNLIFVSKARIIMDDYPETISLSVRLLPSISEDETGEAMMKFEEILQEYKPKQLIELEVSITNKVVY